MVGGDDHFRAFAEPGQRVGAKPLDEQDARGLQSGLSLELGKRRLGRDDRQTTDDKASGGAAAARAVRRLRADARAEGITMLPGHWRYALSAPEAEAPGPRLMRMLVRLHGPHPLYGSVQEERAPMPEALTFGGGGLMSPTSPGSGDPR